MSIFTHRGNNSQQNELLNSSKKSLKGARSIIRLKPLGNPFCFEIVSIIANSASKKELEFVINNNISKHNIPLVLLTAVTSSILELNHLSPWIRKDDLIVEWNSSLHYLRYDQCISINYGQGQKFDIFFNISPIYIQGEYCIEIAIYDRLQDNQLSTIRYDNPIIYFSSVN